MPVRRSTSYIGSHKQHKAEHWRPLFNLQSHALSHVFTQLHAKWWHDYATVIG